MLKCVLPPWQGHDVRVSVDGSWDSQQPVYISFRKPLLVGHDCREEEETETDGVDQCSMKAVSCVTPDPICSSAHAWSLWTPFRLGLGVVYANPLAQRAICRGARAVVPDALVFRTLKSSNKRRSPP